jgi:hypothetical protein
LLKSVAKIKDIMAKLFNANTRHYGAVLIATIVNVPMGS